jgi:hypothetical protein
MYELVQKKIVSQVAQFQTIIVQLAIIQCASDVDELDDYDDIVVDVLVAMQLEAVDELDETDEIDGVAMNQAVDVLVVECFRDDVETQQIE